MPSKLYIISSPGKRKTPLPLDRMGRGGSGVSAIFFGSHTNLSVLPQEPLRTHLESSVMATLSWAQFLLCHPPHLFNACLMGAAFLPIPQLLYDPSCMLNVCVLLS